MSGAWQRILLVGECSWHVASRRNAALSLSIGNLPSSFLFGQVGGHIGGVLPYHTWSYNTRQPSLYTMVLYKDILLGILCVQVI